MIAGLDMCVDRSLGLYSGTQIQTPILFPSSTISGRKIVVFIQLVILTTSPVEFSCWTRNRQGTDPRKMGHRDVSWDTKLFIFLEPAWGVCVCLSVCLMGESIKFCAAGWEWLRGKKEVSAPCGKGWIPGPGVTGPKSDPWLLSPSAGQSRSYSWQPTFPGPPGFHKCHRDPLPTSDQDRWGLYRAQPSLP